MNSLTAGQQLGTGESLQSSTGAFVLTLQDDGNLVLSQRGSVAWASGTNGQGVDRLAVQEDGNAVLYAGGDSRWSTGTDGNPEAHFALQDDGNLVLYGADGTSLWASNTVSPEPDAPAAAPEPVPAAEPAAPAAPAAQEYVVESGDTLSAIAQRFYGDAGQYAKIAQVNGIDNPDLIQVGQRLIIPN